MSAIAAPFGLRPATAGTAGAIRPAPQAYTIASGYNTNIFNGAPVAIDANGFLVVATAGAGNRFVGIFQGCEYVDSTGQPRVSMFWPANTVATNITAYVIMDPNQEYDIQADASVALALIGSQGALINPAAGSAAIGNSTAALQASTLSPATPNQLSVIGFAPGPDNAPGDAFTIVRVRIAQHQFVPSQNPF